MSGPIRPGDVLAAKSFGPFGREAVEAYAAASGDDNPLHLDPALAARAGLARPPVHGMLLVGCVEPFLGVWRPGVTILRLSAKFIRPVLVDEAVMLSGKVLQLRPDGRSVLRLSVKRDADLACLVEVTVRP